jgi:hypothetical protein
MARSREELPVHLIYVETAASGDVFQPVRIGLHRPSADTDAGQLAHLGLGCVSMDERPLHGKRVPGRVRRPRTAGCDELDPITTGKDDPLASGGATLAGELFAASILGLVVALAGHYSALRNSSNAPDAQRRASASRARRRDPWVNASMILPALHRWVLGPGGVSTASATPARTRSTPEDYARSVPDRLAHVNELLTYLERANDHAALINDPWLNERLDPFRTLRPIPLKCPGRRCSATLAYLALSATDARVQFAPRRQPVARSAIRIGERHSAATPIISGAYDLEYPGLVGSGRFSEYIEWAMTPAATIRLAANPNVGSGWPLRFTAHCPRGHPPYPLTNTTLLLLLIRVAAYEEHATTPGRRHGGV